MAQSPFALVNAVTHTKRDLIALGECAESDYVPFIVNRALSYHIDTVMHANEMNMHADIPRTSQFQYFLNTIRPRKRFAKWHKPDMEALEAVSRYYGLNLEKARTALPLLTTEHIESIKVLVKQHERPD